MSHDVFLSYSREDHDTMQRVKDTLTTAGLTVWTDEGIQLGEDQWQMALQQAIEDAVCLVVILSPDAKKSRWVLREINYAREQAKRVFPILARGSTQNAVPFVLVGAQFADIRQRRAYHAKMTQLVKTINDLPGVQRRTTPAPPAVETAAPATPPAASSPAQKPSTRPAPKAPPRDSVQQTPYYTLDTPLFEHLKSPLTETTTAKVEPLPAPAAPPEPSQPTTASFPPLKLKDADGSWTRQLLPALFLDMKKWVAFRQVYGPETSLRVGSASAALLTWWPLLIPVLAGSLRLAPNNFVWGYFMPEGETVLAYCFLVGVLWLLSFIPDHMSHLNGKLRLLGGLLIAPLAFIVGGALSYLPDAHTLPVVLAYSVMLSIPVSVAIALGGPVARGAAIGAGLGIGGFTLTTDSVAPGALTIVLLLPLGLIAGGYEVLKRTLARGQSDWRSRLLLVLLLLAYVVLIWQLLLGGWSLFLGPKPTMPPTIVSPWL